MQEITTQGVRLSSVAGNNASILRANKTISLQSNEVYDYSDVKARVLSDNDTIIVGKKTFILIGDSTKYPDPYTSIVALPDSEFKVSVKPWEFIDKIKNEHTTGFKITRLELIKGIFKIETGAEVKARNANFSFSKNKGSIKIEITNNAMYIGGSDAVISGPFSNKSLSLTQFGEYIITEGRFYKKSLLAINEKNRMDERFMAFDMLFLKVYNSAMSMSQKNLDAINKSAESFNPADFTKGLDTAMNMNPETLKQTGLGPEQVKQMTEALDKFKKEMTPDKMAMFKNAISTIKKDDMIKSSKSIKTIMQSSPKTDELAKDFEAIVPYGPIPGKPGECEEASV